MSDRESNHLLDVDWSQIPAPADDGAADHLAGAKVCSLSLPATDGSSVDLSAIAGCTVVYIYPMTGRPDRPSPDGWDAIPGARGCSAQSCAFRDHAGELRSLGVGHIFGLSVQTTDYQREAADRLHLPFPLLSDEHLAFASAMQLPTFDVDGTKLLKRMTLLVEDGTIVHIRYPVFPPDEDAQAVIDWLGSRP